MWLCLAVCTLTCVPACLHVNSKQKHHDPKGQRRVIKYKPLRYTSLYVHMYVERTSWLFLAREEGPQVWLQTRQRKKAATAAVTQTFPAPLPLAWNVSCAGNAEKCNSSPLCSTYCWNSLMWICNYVQEIFSCSFPKNSNHIQTQLSAAVHRKEAHPCDIWLTHRHLHFCFVFGPQPCNVLFIFPLLRGKAKAVYVNCMSNVHALFCFQHTDRPTPEQKIMSHLLI